MSHAEWFKEIGVSESDMYCRGYCYCGVVTVYEGDFKVPRAFNRLHQYAEIADAFNCNIIHAGCIKGQVGDVWLGEYTINVNK